MGMQLDYNEDDIIISEKSESRFMYLVLEGTVALYSGYQTADEYLYGLVGKGKTFGEVGLLTHSGSAYTAVATTNVKVAVFSENELGTFIRHYPDQALGIMRSVARMSRIFSVNLKMVLEENKTLMQYEQICADAIKLGTVDEESEEAKATWRYVSAVNKRLS